jgi:hypothetical protein
MRNRIDIDPKRSRGIVQQIGEGLAAFLKEEPQLPASLRARIDPLRELEEQSPSTISGAEPETLPWNTARPNRNAQCDR